MDRRSFLTALVAMGVLPSLPKWRDNPWEAWYTFDSVRKYWILRSLTMLEVDDSVSKGVFPVPTTFPREKKFFPHEAKILIAVSNDQQQELVEKI